MSILDRRIVVIGAGPGGICTAIRLREAGCTDVVVLEKASGIGGTWFHNRYPGAECDVQSHLYSFSFELKTDWSQPYATQPEILDYLEHVVDAYALAPLIRFDTEVVSLDWDDDEAVWQVRTAGGETIRAHAVVSAVGMFNELNVPEIEGMSSFGGTIFHTARWDPSHDLAGRNVAVVGSAASAVQLIPEVAELAGRLHVFQRSAQWVAPKDDTPFTDDQLERFRSDPMAGLLRRWKVFRTVEATITFDDPERIALAEEASRRNIAQVTDPGVRAALTPDVPYGCRRPLVSNRYYPAFNRDNVELVTDAIERITPTGIVTADGTERAVDTIVLATGFQTTRYLSAIEVRGRGGRRIDEAWSDGPQAYLGITTAGFPNLFMLYGPNTNNGSIIYMLECQVGYVVRQLRRMAGEAIDWIDVRPDAMAAYNDELQRALDGIGVWQSSCSGYYRGPTGRIVTQWPHTMTTYRDRLNRPDPEAYEHHQRAEIGAQG